MRQLKFGFVILLAITLAQPVMVLGKGRPLGAIAGTIRDIQGQPISGALVKLIDLTLGGSTLRSIPADHQGNFYARNILPGTYQLRAQARGFMSAVKPVEIRSDVVLTLTFELKRVGTLADQRPDRDDYRWLVRGLPRPVLRLQGDDEPVTEIADATHHLLSQARRVNGLVQFVSGAPLSNFGPTPGYAGVNFALAGHAAPNLELVFLGQVSNHVGSPHRFELMASTYAGDTHQLTARMGYAKLRALGDSFSMHDFNQLSLAVVDAWQVAGPVVLIYGVDLTRFSGSATQWVASPRLGVALNANAETRLSAEYFPVSNQDVQAQGEFDYEGGQVAFTTPENLMLVSHSSPAPRNRRLQVAIERQLDEASSVEAAFFFDEFAGRGVGVLAVPIDAAGPWDEVWQTFAQQGQTRGARVSYRRELTSFLTGLVGYSVGQGQRVRSGGAVDPVRMFRDASFQVLSLRLDANVARTGTRISTTYRLGSEDALFGIDPFYGRLDVFDPSLNIALTQELPDFGILPGRWEAGVDARNLLDQPEGCTAGGHTVLLGQARRSIRGSVSVRF
jgi:hypothetical protein